MKINNNEYKIELNLLNVLPKSTSKDIVLNPEEIVEQDFVKYVYIKYNKYKEPDLKEIYILCDHDVSGDKYFCLCNDIIIFLLNKIIVKFDLNTGRILLKKEIPTIACNYELYKIDENYLIIGEWEITCLDANFEKIWQHSGHDIYDNVKIDFDKKLIYITEFMNSDSYSITFDGKR